MDPETKRNLLIAPVVLFVRAPLLLVLHRLIALGEWADRVSDIVADALPGFTKRDNRL